MYKAAQGHKQIHVDKWSKLWNPRWPLFSIGDQFNKNNDILMIICCNQVIDTLCLTVIHLRINLFK